MPPFTNEHVSPLPFEPEGERIPLAANESNRWSKEILAATPEKLRTLKKASLWFVKEGNGSSREQVLDHQNRIQDINDRLEYLGENNTDS